MDLQMPEMDGFTATQEIRKTDNNIPIVALTANSMSQEKEKCLSSGFNDYITKPFKPDMLKERILFFVSNNEISPKNAPSSRTAMRVSPSSVITPTLPFFII